LHGWTVEAVKNQHTGEEEREKGERERTQSRLNTFILSVLSIVGEVKEQEREQKLELNLPLRLVMFPLV
jgi:hypothetical protein